MNEIVKKFLLAGDKLMPTYSVCRRFTKNKEYKNLKKQEIKDIFINMN